MDLDSVVKDQGKGQELTSLTTLSLHFLITKSYRHSRQIAWAHTSTLHYVYS